MKKYSNKLKDVAEISKTRLVQNQFRNKDLKSLLLLETSFLADNIRVSDRLWYVNNDIHSRLTCPICNKPGNINRVTNSVKCISKKCDMLSIDPATGLTKGQIIGLKIKETNSKVNPETGLTGYQTSVLKTKETLSKIDPATGLTGYQTSGLKTKETLSKIDPATSLTKGQIIGLKIKETNSKVNPETGLTKYQENGLKIKETNSKVNPETGLTKYQENGLKTKETLSKVDPETGLTGYQEKGLKTKETLSKIDSETGLTGYQILGINSKLGNSKVNPETGLTGYQKSGIKSKETLYKIDSETGLTGYQKSGIKSKETNSKIDPETGLTGYQTSGLKIKETLSKIDPETGLTGYQSNTLKCSISNIIKSYNSRSLYFQNGYKLLTTKDEYLNSRLLRYSCDECGSIRESYWPYIRCTKCYPYNKSMGEHEVLEFCQSLTSKVQSNPRNIIPPLELDIYLPNHNLAIEYNGLYWHSSYSNETENSTRHSHKTEQCASKDIQLFHIFENEWLAPQKQEIWKSIIRNKLGFSDRIFARKSIVTKITSKDTKEFLNSNHLQGACVSSVNLGLTLDDELVAIMTFGRSRYDKGVDWELLRYCGKLNTSVVGGAGKLLAQFRRENSGSIISYADKRRSNGNLYDKLGFELSHESAPNYWYYIDPMILESRVKYQKHKLRDKLEIFDDKLSESDNMYMNGYRKIYDCGNQVWKLK